MSVNERIGASMYCIIYFSSKMHTPHDNSSDYCNSRTLAKLHIDDSNNMTIYEILSPMMSSEWIWYRYIVEALAPALVAIFGTIGNLHAIFILKTFPIRATVSILLGAMALVDMAVCGVSLIYFSISYCVMPIVRVLLHVHDAAEVKLIFDHLTAYTHFFSQQSIVLSCWMMTIVTTERFFALSRPLAHRIFDTEKRAILMCVSAFLATFLLCAPTFWELEVIACYIHQPTDTDRLFSLVWGTGMRQNELYMSVYGVFINALFVTIGPFTIISIVTCLMICIVRKSKRDRAKMTNDGASNTFARRASTEKLTTVISITTINVPSTPKIDKTTLMLLVICMKFLLLNTLLIILNVLELIDPNLPHTEIFTLLANISNFMVIVNCATNCLVYYRWKNRWKRNRATRKIEKAHSVHRSNNSRNLSSPDGSIERVTISMIDNGNGKAATVLNGTPCRLTPDRFFKPTKRRLSYKNIKNIKALKRNITTGHLSCNSINGQASQNSVTSTCTTFTHVDAVRLSQMYSEVSLPQIIDRMINNVCYDSSQETRNSLSYAVVSFIDIAVCHLAENEKQIDESANKTYQLFLHKGVKLDTKFYIALKNNIIMEFCSNQNDDPTNESQRSLATSFACYLIKKLKEQKYVN